LAFVFAFLSCHLSFALALAFAFPFCHVSFAFALHSHLILSSNSSCSLYF
jgi:hypothetical protein